jgi:hypothetical protein
MWARMMLNDEFFREICGGYSGRDIENDEWKVRVKVESGRWFAMRQFRCGPGSMQGLGARKEGLIHSDARWDFERRSQEGKPDRG